MINATQVLLEDPFNYQRAVKFIEDKKVLREIAGFFESDPYKMLNSSGGQLVIRGLASNKYTDKDVIYNIYEIAKRSYFKYPSLLTSLLIGIVSNENCPVDILSEVLLSDKYPPVVREHAIKSPAITEDLLKKAVDLNNSFYDLINIIYNKNITEDVLLYLCERMKENSNSYIFEIIAGSPELTPKVAKALLDATSNLPESKFNLILNKLLENHRLFMPVHDKLIKKLTEYMQKNERKIKGSLQDKINTICKLYKDEILKVIAEDPDIDKELLVELVLAAGTDIINSHMLTGIISSTFLDIGLDTMETYKVPLNLPESDLCELGRCFIQNMLDPKLFMSEIKNHNVLRFWFKQFKWAVFRAENSANAMGFIECLLNNSELIPALGEDGIELFLAAIKFCNFYMNRDSYVKVYEAALSNPGIPISILKKLLNESLWDTHKRNKIQRGLAANPGITPEICRTLIKNRSPIVREALAKNPSTPVDVLKILRKSSVEAIRKPAEQRLAS